MPAAANPSRLHDVPETQHGGAAALFPLPHSSTLLPTTTFTPASEPDLNTLTATNETIRATDLLD
jgi:hypothetical protein